MSVNLDLPRLYRISPAGTLGCLATGFANGAFWSLAPVFTTDLSGDVSLAAWFMTTTVFGGAVAQWPLGYLSDRIGRRKIQTASALGGFGVAVCILLFASGLGMVSIALLGAAWGAFAFPLYAISVAHANDHADPSEYVMVSGGLLLMYGAGAIAGPFVASAMMTAVGPLGLYLFTAGIHALLVIYTLQRIVRRESAPSEEHIAFSDALATVQTASQVYEEEILHSAEADEEGSRQAI